MTPTPRRATAVHEAAHAVTSFALGLKFMYIVWWDDSNAEVTPETGSCPTCDDDFERRRGADAHVREIQDTYRKRIAVGVAGEEAERILLGDGATIDPEEVFMDRSKARKTACWGHMHVRFCGGRPWDDPCDISDPFIGAMRRRVAELLNEQFGPAVLKLADRLESLTEQRLFWNEAADLIASAGVTFDSVKVSELPPFPT